MTLRQFLSVVELRTKVVSISTFSMAALYALWRFGEIRVAESLVCLAAALAVDMGTTAFNSYFDYLRGIDHAETNRERDKVLLHEGVPPAGALLAAVLCYLFAAAAGLAVAFLSGFWVIAAGGAGLAAGFLYSGGPKPISRTPFGELAAGGFLGFGLFLIAYRVAAGGIDWSAALAALPGFFFVASILAANNTCDTAGDRAAGRRTLPIVLGKRYGEALLYTGGLAAFCLPAILAVTGAYPPWSALGSGIAGAAAFPLYLRMARRGYSHLTKSATMKDVVMAFAIWSLGMAAGFAAGVML